MKYDDKSYDDKSYDDMTGVYTLRVREYLDAKARWVKLQPDSPEYGLWEERMEDLWYSMTPIERNQVRKEERGNG